MGAGADDSENRRPEKPQDARNRVGATHRSWPAVAIRDLQSVRRWLRNMREWRPDPGYSAPIVVLAVAGSGACLWAGWNLILMRNSPAAVLFGAVAVLLVASPLMYFRNARIIVSDRSVAKRNIVGRITECPRDQIARLETRYQPQPTLCFIRPDGKLAFRVNQRLWRDTQIQEIRDALR
jgi:hypothetical protein